MTRRGDALALGMAEPLPARQARVLHEFRRYAMPPVAGEACVECPTDAPRPMLIYNGRCEACHVGYYKAPRYRVPQPPPPDDEQP